MTNVYVPPPPSLLGRILIALGRRRVVVRSAHILSPETQSRLLAAHITQTTCSAGRGR